MHITCTTDSSVDFTAKDEQLRKRHKFTFITSTLSYYKCLFYHFNVMHWQQQQQQQHMPQNQNVRAIVDTFGMISLMLWYNLI